MGNSKTKKYWKSVRHYNDENLEEDAQHEFHKSTAEALAGDLEKESQTNRRDFLKAMGFTTLAATIAACQAPVRKVVPYVNKPHDVNPGVANYYASSYYDGFDYASIVVKTREGRPIFIEPNTLSSINPSGVNTRVNASLLSLYDSSRLKDPVQSNDVVTWTHAIENIKDRLQEVTGEKVLLTNSIISPTTKKLVEKFAQNFGVEHIEVDAVSYSGILEANKSSLGQRIIPNYNLEKADVVVGIDADFLATWLFPSAFCHQYGKKRKPGPKMLKHIQFESHLTLSGSNADERYATKISELSLVVSQLYNEIAKATGSTTIANSKIEKDVLAGVKKTARKLLSAKGKSLVLCGINNKSVQILVNEINYLLSNYGSTIDTTKSIKIKNGDDSKYLSFIESLKKKGNVGAVITYGLNPSYNLPHSKDYVDGISEVPLTVAIDTKQNESASLMEFVLPVNHPLESWGDFEPVSGEFSFAQPTINPLFNTKQFEEILLMFNGGETSYYKVLKSEWASLNWSKTIQDGVHKKETSGALAFKSSDVRKVRSSLSKLAIKGEGGLEVKTYVKSGIGDGSNANNPWLQEFPDPISKITWDNYLTMAPSQMREMGLSMIERGETYATEITLKVGDIELIVPVVPQPGQKKGTVSLALGYGRSNEGKVADHVGVNASVLHSVVDGASLGYALSTATVTPTGNEYPIGATQTHHTLMGRDTILRETTLAAYNKNSKSGNKKTTYDTYKGKVEPEKLNLWQEHPTESHGYRWGLSIDLNSCIGCGACVTACQSENNVPVVGKDEVRRAREMHWIRIDRYYSSDADESGNLTEMEKASDNPEVAFQPVMCQHCNNAPCETVCPVAATTHSAEGLNQMTYNRCIGTRYCANNCPYKVRRFNWFKYHNNDKFDFNMNDEYGKLVLNPDVTIRSRGVMEKCSLCVQRIQDGKLTAKEKGKSIKDGDIKVACQTACSGDAIVFGDLNDEEGVASAMSKDDRAYELLEEIGVKPNVYYLTKVRNKS